MVIMPSDNNPPQGFPVKKGFMVSFTKPTTGNSAITFKVMDQTLTQLMKINGKDKVELIPTEVKSAPKTFEILAPGMSQGLWFNFTSCLVVNLRVGFLSRRSRSRSRNLKCRAKQCGESQTDGIETRVQNPSLIISHWIVSLRVLCGIGRKWNRSNSSDRLQFCIA